ncbi:hypothetical protein NE237_013812 [Protea cynaroides]|uniref:Uncharacterized protein n=1 Tax=Protea cynaroides TaxID=273540 RepID=A0A9Q0H0M7_9MAGN|nr:hypothetical protein NE237_013812 [Protea cynaroides]
MENFWPTIYYDQIHYPDNILPNSFCIHFNRSNCKHIEGKNPPFPPEPRVKDKTATHQYKENENQQRNPKKVTGFDEEPHRDREPEHGGHGCALVDHELPTSSTGQGSIVLLPSRHRDLAHGTFSA